MSSERYERDVKTHGRAYQQSNPYFLLNQYISICSNVLPLVSGTSFQVISIAGIHIKANSQNVPCGLRFYNNQGTDCPII